MRMMMKSLALSAAMAVVLTVPAVAADCEKPAAAPAVEVMPFHVLDLDPAVRLLALYTAAESHHRLAGLASYYSNSLDGTLTANGERYHKKKLTAAHLTLPLGTWIEVTSRATGKRIRLRVNDRGPYVKKFCIDLSRAAARALGVDVTEDRTVLIRLVQLPGHPALPDDVLRGPVGVASEEAGW